MSRDGITVREEQTTDGTLWTVALVTHSHRALTALRTAAEELGVPVTIVRDTDDDERR